MADETVGVIAETEPKVTAEEPITADPKDGEEVDPQASPNPGEPQHKKLGGWQRKQLKAEAERDYWRDVALAKLQDKPEVKAKADEDPEPKKEDFIVDKEAQTYDPEKYQAAVRAWDRRQAKKEALAEIDQREQQKSQKSEQQKQAEGWEQKKAVARAKYDDFDDALDADVPITQAISKVLLTSELGADLAYYLGTHPGEAQKIAKMDDIGAALAMGRIEATLAKQETDEPEEKHPAVTKAAPPPQPVKKATASKAPDIYDDSLPYKEWVKTREAGLKKGK